MKALLNFIQILVLVLFVNMSFSQNTNSTFNYSEIARNATGEPLANAAVQVQIAIHFGSKTNLANYIENHTASTDNNGKFTVVIGEGTPISGDYSNLPWGFEKSYIETFVNGLSISNIEIEKPRGYGKYNNINNVAGNKINKPVNSNVVEMGPNEMPLTHIQIGDKTLKPGKGIMFFGKSPNHTIQLQDQITITAGEGVEISGTYPNIIVSLKKHYIGEEYLGGKVAYVDNTGQHGFVVYPTLLGPANWHTFPWGHQFKNDIHYDDFIPIGNHEEGIGYGWGNTQNLFKRDNIDLNVPDVGEVESIPQMLDNFDNHKWFLPSLYELKEIYKNRVKLGFTGNFYNKFIWSSNLDYGHFISKGHNDRFNGTSSDPNQNTPHNKNTRIYNKLKINEDDKIIGVKCINFSSGKTVPILAVYEHYFFVIREF